MSSSTIATVNDLKVVLTKTSSDNAERLLDALNRLDECDVTLSVLSTTLVGAAVSKLKNHDVAEVSERANGLVKKWKGVAKAGVAKKSSARKKPPAASSPSVPEETMDWGHLPPLRKKFCSAICNVFLQCKAELVKNNDGGGGEGLDSSAVSSLSSSRAAEVEGAAHSLLKRDQDGYKDKVRSLVFNLKRNASLRKDVLLGGTSPQELVKMTSEQLLSSDRAAERAKSVEQLRESRRLDWEEANEGKINEQCGIKGDLLNASLFTCGRCKSIKTTSTQKQTRSADEPMTVFVLCLNCNLRWKC